MHKPAMSYLNLPTGRPPGQIFINKWQRMSKEPREREEREERK
jgi:hypothetical protein